MFFCCKIKKNKKNKSDVIIIDWGQSLSQCGGDEDFLYELLRETHKEIKNPISEIDNFSDNSISCLLYTSPSPRDLSTSRMPSSA